MRVTESMGYRSLLDNYQSINDQLDTATNQVSSGKRLAHLRDDPILSGQLVGVRGQLDLLDQYSTNAGNSSFYIGVTDSTLSTVYDRLNTIFNRGSDAATGTSNASTRADLAKEIRSLRDEILDLANTRVRGRYIFSGSLVGTKAYSISGDTVTYQGDSEANTVQISDGAQVQLNVPGSTAFTTIFADTASLLAAIDANNQSGIQTALDNFKTGRDSLSRVRTQVGADLTKAKDVDGVLDNRKTDLKTLQSSMEDANQVEAISKMNQLDTTLRAALSAGSFRQKRNLFDYLG